MGEAVVREIRTTTDSIRALTADRRSAIAGGSESNKSSPRGFGRVAEPTSSIVVAAAHDCTVALQLP
jgi:hypothetical protein